MNTIKTFFFIIIIFIAFFSWPQQNEIEKFNFNSQQIIEKTPEPILLEPRFIHHQMKFSSQAPFQEWNNDRYQDGCEEASVLMVMVNKGIDDFNSKTEVKNKILSMSKFQEELVGEYRDSSIADTAQILITGYYGFTDYKIMQLQNKEELIQEILNNNIVIAPTNGQLLNNKFYTPPGPKRHMLIIIGYNPDTNEFITNDPGTKHGKDYKYNTDLLFNAIRDYPSGNHQPITNSEKNVIVIKR